MFMSLVSCTDVCGGQARHTCRHKECNVPHADSSNEVKTYCHQLRGQSELSRTVCCWYPLLSESLDAGYMQLLLEPA